MPTASPLRAHDDGLLLARDDDFDYRIDFLQDPRVVAVRTFGPVDLAGWARLYQGLIGDPRVRGQPLLLDHTQLDATFLLNADGRMMAQIARNMDEELQPPRGAIVLVEGFELGLMRTCRAQLNADTDLNQRVREFRSHEAALAWLVESARC